MFKKELGRDGCWGEQHLMQLAEATVLPNYLVKYLFDKLDNALPDKHIKHD